MAETQSSQGFLHHRVPLLRRGGVSIRARVTWTLIIFFTALMPVVVLSTYYSSGMFRSIEQIVSVDVRLAIVAEDVSQSMLQARRAEKNFLLFGDPSYLDEITANLSRIDSLVSEGIPLSQAEQPRLDNIANLIAQYRLTLDTLVALAEGERRRDPYAQIRQEFAEHRKTFDQMIREALSTKGKAKRDSLLAQAMDYLGAFDVTKIGEISSTSPDRNRLLADLKHVSSAVDSLASRIATQARADMESHRMRGERLGTRGQRNTLTALMLTIILVICLLIFMPARTVRPITRLTNVIHQAGEGDLKVRLESLPSDEVGELALHLNKLLSRAQAFDQLKVHKIIEGENRFRSLANNVDKGVAATDLKGCIALANHAFAELAAFDTKEIVGKSIEELPNFKNLGQILNRMVSEKSKVEEVEIALGEDPVVHHPVHLELVRDGSGQAASVLIIIGKHAEC
jgi:PAS domain S-box-containing protein